MSDARWLSGASDSEPRDERCVKSAVRAAAVAADGEDSGAALDWPGWMVLLGLLGFAGFEGFVRSSEVDELGDVGRWDGLVEARVVDDGVLENRAAVDDAEAMFCA